MSDLARRAAQYEAVQRRGSAYARRVSAALNRAGVPKASRYKTFGRDRDGFQMYSNGGRVAVLFTSRKVGLAWHELAKELLTAAGFTIGRERRLDRSYSRGGFDLVTGIEDPAQPAATSHDEAAHE